MRVAMGKQLAWCRRHWLRIMISWRKEALHKEVMELEIQRGYILELHKDALKLWDNIQEAIDSLPQEAKHELVTSPGYKKIREAIGGITKAVDGGK